MVSPTPSPPPPSSPQHSWVTSYPPNTEATEKSAHIWNLVRVLILLTLQCWDTVVTGGVVTCQQCCQHSVCMRNNGWNFIYFFLFQQNLPGWTWGCICMHHLPPLMQWLCKAYILETIFLLFVVVGILASLEQTMLQCWFCLLPLVDVARCCWRKMLVGCWSILMKIRTECCCWLLPEHILGC